MSDTAIIVTTIIVIVLAMIVVIIIISSSSLKTNLRHQHVRHRNHGNSTPNIPELRLGPVCYQDHQPTPSSVPIITIIDKKRCSRSSTNGRWKHRIDHEHNAAQSSPRVSERCLKCFCLHRLCLLSVEELPELNKLSFLPMPVVCLSAIPFHCCLPMSKCLLLINFLLSLSPSFLPPRTPPPPSHSCCTLFTCTSALEAFPSSWRSSDLTASPLTPQPSQQATRRHSSHQADNISANFT